MQSDDGFSPGDLLVGKFRVVGRIASGGMGVVYEVEHTLTRHRRALKVINTALAADAAFVKRFLREASAAGRIGSPHIVETFDAGLLDDGAPYLLMELIAGKTLAQVLEERRQLPFAEACTLIAQACRGVAAAHEAGIVHRDIKPENLVVTGPELAFVKILDFGICKLEDDESSRRLTREGSPIGTPSYMAPEQLRGAPDLDGRADVYALGVVLYECLTGELPYAASTLPALAIAIHEGTYPPATKRCPELPEITDALVSRAIHPDPKQRFATALEFASELERLARESTQALSETLPGQSEEGRTPPMPAAPSEAPRGPPARRTAALVFGLVVSAGVALWFAAKRTPSNQAETPVASATRVLSPPVPSASTPPPRSEPRTTSSAPWPPPQPSETAPRRAQVNGTPFASGSAVHHTPAPRSRAADYDLVEENPF